MKKLLLLLAISIMATAVSAQQAKKPTIMLLPSDHWCSVRYFTKVLDNQGVKQTINDYDSAFRTDAELPQVVSKVGELMTSLGYDLKDFMMENKALNDRMLEEQVTMSKSGASVIETPLDMLRRTVKYDIELCVDWDIISEGNKKAVRFTIEAFDSYTNKRIATSTGVGKPSSKGIAYQIEGIISDKINTFDSQLKQFLSKQQVSGREVRLSVRMWDSAAIDLEAEFGGKELIEYIQLWLKANTVNSAFNLTNATESRAQFEQVMIPCFDDSGMAIDARAFVSKLRKYLRKEPFNIESKVVSRGLGEAILIIGEK